MRTGTRGTRIFFTVLMTLAGSLWLAPHRAEAQILPPLPGDLVVTITSPQQGAIVSGTITVSASVSPVGALVGGVQFKVDGANLGAEDTTAPYSIPWNTIGNSNGSHTLTAVARDALGLQFQSQPVSVTVSNAPPPDTTPPTVSITSPASGATVSGTTTVSASASDNVGVAGVQFFVDGSALGSEDTTSPYSVSWNTTTAANGSHSLTAKARDAAGNTTTSAAVTVTVSNAPPPDTTPPTVSITSPASGATVSGTTTVSASASDNVGVAGVQFFVDGSALGAEDTTSPYSVSWNTTTVANGSHSLTARARDAAGNSTTSTAVTVTVSNAPPPDTTPPTVSITSPASGATVSGTTTVSASASDNVGVSGVQFFVDGSALGSEDTSSPYSVSWNTTTVANGSHSLTARARDAAGNSTTSTAVTVTVSNAPPPDTTPPTVSITSPASGATVSGTTTVSASASDNVGVSGVQFFVDGSTIGAEDTSAPYSVSWDTTTVSNGNHTLTATARDAAGNRTTSASVTVTVSPDPTPPSVSITSPSSGATVSGTITVSASASDNVGVSGVFFLVDGAVLGAEDTTSPYSVSWNTTTVSNGSHSLTATARDGAGNRTTSAPVTVTVSNAPPADTTPPTVSITSPSSGATVSGTTTVNASASDNVGVAGVQFFVDGSALGAEDTSSPYSASWNTTAVANGSHSLTARARDAAGNQTTSAAVTVTVSNGTPPSTTRFEESAATLTPSGAWSETTSAGVGATLSGDRAVFSATSGARASFTFSGTGVSWIGLPCEICGFSNVFLDGALVGTVDTYAATRPAASRVMFTRSGLAAGSHTLAIEATGTQNAASGGANILVDAFDVEGSTGGSGPRRVEENDPSVSYTGTWLTQSRGDLSGGTVVESSDTGGTASLAFNSTGVKWIGFKGPWAGIGEVYLDGTLKATVDTYAPIEQAQVVLYSVSGLPAGTHTIKIRVTGTWSSSSSSAWVVVDAFDVE